MRRALLCLMLAGCAGAPSAPTAPASIDLLYAAPQAAHRALAHLHARGTGELRKEAAALGADALVVLEARESGIDALAIEYLP